MTDQHLFDISKAIGALTSEVSALRRDIQQAELRAVDGVRRADEHRAIIHRRVDELVETVAEVRTDIATAHKDIADMKPVTDDVRKWKLMGLGALGVVGFGGMALGVTLSGALQSIVHFLRGI